jgi:hypothetical protein
LEKSGWHFFETALNMLVKAFFTDELEQLLWHITAIDALLGEKGDVTEKLARRVASILGKTEDQQTKLKDSFKELYNFRSALVHGKRFDDEDPVDVGHLRKARDFARQTFIWFLDILITIQNGILQGRNASEYPEQGIIQKIIDSRFRGFAHKEKDKKLLARVDGKIKQIIWDYYFQDV